MDFITKIRIFVHNTKITVVYYVTITKEGNFIFEFRPWLYSALQFYALTTSAIKFTTRGTLYSGNSLVYEKRTAPSSIILEDC